MGLPSFGRTASTIRARHRWLVAKRSAATRYGANCPSTGFPAPYANLAGLSGWYCRALAVCGMRQQSFPDARAHCRPAGVRAVQLDGVAEAAGRDDEAPIEHVGEPALVHVGEFPVGGVVAAVGHRRPPSIRARAELSMTSGRPAPRAIDAPVTAGRCLDRHSPHSVAPCHQGLGRAPVAALQLSKSRSILGWRNLQGLFQQLVSQFTWVR